MQITSNHRVLQMVLTLSLMKHKSWDLPPPSDLFFNYLNICGDLLIVVDIDMDVVTFNSLGTYNHVSLQQWNHIWAFYIKHKCSALEKWSLYVDTMFTNIYEHAICSTKGKGMWKSRPIRKETTKTSLPKLHSSSVMVTWSWRSQILSMYIAHSKMLL